MAIDEAIVESVGKGLVPPTFRFYSWRPPAVSIGCYQKISEIDQQACILKNYDIVRRPTGGRAILHDKELTYSVIAPVDNKLISRNILNTYKILHKGFMVGLQGLGLEPRMVSGRNNKGTKSYACFFSPSIYELTVRGKKIIGSAQRRWNKVVLQQGSMPLDINIEELFSVLSHRNREILIKKAEKKMTSINNELGKNVDIEKLKKAVVGGFEEALGIKLQPDRLTDHEAATAFRLSIEKYSNREWNFKK